MAIRRVHFVGASGFKVPWERQIPDGGNTWGQTEYLEAIHPEDEPDWLVVYEAWPSGAFATKVPRERRVLVCAEPEGFHRYQRKYLGQFGHVITTQRRTGHPNVIHSQPGISWFVGVRFGLPGEKNEYPLVFKDFTGDNPKKTKLCSIVCSDKAVSRGHVKRLAFVKRLKEEFGDVIDFYGRGFNEVKDKDEALAQYRFHIAIENSVYDDYWTEKLADSFLRGAFPVYSGCPNLLNYFPADSFVSIDIDKPIEAINTIRKVLSSDLDLVNSDALAEAKRRVLWEHNALAVLERVWEILEKKNIPRNFLESDQLLLCDEEWKRSRIKSRIVSAIKRLMGKGAK